MLGLLIVKSFAVYTSGEGVVYCVNTVPWTLTPDIALSIYFCNAASCVLPQRSIDVFPSCYELCVPETHSICISGLCVRIRSTAVCLEAIRNMYSLARALATCTETISQTTAEARKTRHLNA
eukprot:166296-Heterocapsa_arctica.AAC.1